MVGIHLSPKVVKDVGKISLITGVGQVLFTSIIGYFIAIAFGFSAIVAIYVSVALTFSSTIIIMKLLSDKDALEKLYGKVSIGFLLVQDLIAMILLIVLSAFASGEGAGDVLFGVLLKGFLVLAILFPFSLYVLPKLSDFFAKSSEFLFIFAISWGIGFSALFAFMGLSIEVGALIAGILLSMSPYNYEISSKLKTLRDFFIISFFLILGSQMVFSDISSLIVPAAVFSLFILIGNPLIVMILMGIMGYSKKTGFMAGLTVAQISEFSLILIALGVKMGQLSQEILSFVTIIGLITIAGSTYMIIYSEKIFSFISPALSFFEKRTLKEKEILRKQYKYILLGENRIGFSIMKSFVKSKKEYLIIDFNPDRVKKLVSKNINCIYGDVSNLELMEEIDMDAVELIVSTIPDKEVNMGLLRKFKNHKSKTKIIVTSRNTTDTLELYEAGADYVILPHFLGGEYVADLVSRLDKDESILKKEKERQIKDFKERMGETWHDFFRGD
jgi:Kef-type K+ transport system membrane component KefB/Trk K+ transport system NAD-binding subunit